MNTARNVVRTGNAGSVNASNPTIGTSNFVNDAGLTFASTACGSGLPDAAISGASVNALTGNVTFASAPARNSAVASFVVDLSTGAPAEAGEVSTSEAKGETA